MEEKQTKKRQVGNFLLEVLEGADFDFIECRSLIGDWSVRWRNDSVMFSLMFSLMQNKDAEEYLRALFTMMYIATSYTHDLVAIIEKRDLPLINGFCALVNEQNDYEASVAKKTTKEEEEEALKNTVITEELENEIINLEEGGVKDE